MGFCARCLLLLAIVVYFLALFADARIRFRSGYRSSYRYRYRYRSSGGSYDYDGGSGSTWETIGIVVGTIIGAVVTFFGCCCLIIYLKSLCSGSKESTSQGIVLSNNVAVTNASANPMGSPNDAPYTADGTSKGVLPPSYDTVMDRNNGAVLYPSQPNDQNMHHNGPGHAPVGFEATSNI